MAGGFDRMAMVVSVLAILASSWTPTQADPQDVASRQILSGQWKLATDPENRGRADRWFEGVRPEAQEASVPGIIQQVFPSYHGVAWYWHNFSVTPGGAAGDRMLIRFDAVDYVADVWLNGKHIGTHEGGETPFEFDVTDSIRPQGENLLAVRVLNPTAEPIDGY
ncbi:MAG: sugar-binding domain-containing protein, partial [Solirubrobacterales bacterium]